MPKNSFILKVKHKSNSKEVIAEIVNNLPNIMERVMVVAQALALQNKRGSSDKNLILYEVQVTSDGIVGRLYTNFDYASFLEFGTGTKAELPHIGHTDTFKNSGYRIWFLPVEKARKPLNNRVVTIEGTDFYMMFPTQPYPFMRPTAFMMEEKAKEIIAEELRSVLRK